MNTPEPKMKNYEFCTAEKLFKLKEKSGAEPGELEKFIEQSNKYLSLFAAPILNDEGKPVCIGCGEEVDAFKQALGLGVAHRWGMMHGEAVCSGCGWPSRGMHYPKDDKGEEMWSLQNFFLYYHPDVIKKGHKDEA